MLFNNYIKFLLVIGIFLVLTAVTSAQTAPPPPSNLHSSSATSSSISLAWQNNSDSMDKVNIYKKLTTDTYWPTMYMTQVMGTNVASYTDAAVSAGSSYDYYVEACLSGYGCSGASNYLIGVQAGASSSSCTGLALTLDKTSYVIGENVNYTWTCSPSGLATYVTIQLAKPDTSVVTYNTFSGGGQNSMSLGFSTSNLLAGNHTLRACFTPECSGGVTTSANFTVMSSGSYSYSPPSLVTASQSGSSINVSWPVPSPTPPMYKIERSVGGGVYAAISDNTTNLTFNDSSSLISGSTYKYKVYSCSAVGTCSTTGTESNTITYTYTSGGSLTQPALSATTVGLQVNLTWTDYNSTEEGFRIYRRILGYDWPTYPTYTNSQNTTTYSDTLTTAGSYEYKVQVFTSTVSQDSNTVSVSVSSGGGGLTAPYLTANSSGLQAVLYWNDPSSNSETGFKIFRKLSSESWSQIPLVSLEANVVTYSDSTITTAGTYNYKVQVYTSSAYLDSNSVAVSVSSGGGTGAGGTIPQPPSFLTAVASAASVNLTWPTASGATHYNLYRSTYPTAGTWTSVCGSSVTTLSCTDTSMPAGTYQYRIEACASGYGCSGAVNNNYIYSSSVTGTTNTMASCTGLTLTLDKTYYTSTDNVNYIWSCTPGGTAPSVTVQLVKPDTNVVTYNTSTNMSTSSNGFSASNLVVGSYTLRACFTSSCSPVTVSASFTISTTAVNVPPAPGVPVGLSSASSNQSIYFTTTLYSSSGEALKAVFDWGDNTNFSFSEAISASATGTVSPKVYHTYSSAGTYSVRAKSKNASGLESGWSGVFTITINSGGIGTVPAAPSNLLLGSSTNAGIYLKWTDNSINEDKFNIERKLTTSTDWSGALNVQLQGANINSYNDTTIISGTIYDYRVQACLSGTGCSNYAVLSGVTAGTALPLQTAQPVMVKTINGAIVPSGLVAFVKDGVSVSANFNNTSSATIYLFPGTYEMQPSFPAVNNTEVQLTGTGVNNRQIAISSSATAVINVALPIRQSVSIKVNNSAGEPIIGARVAVGIAGSTAYAAGETAGAGVVWLQLANGAYQVMVNKLGYLPGSASLEVGTAGADLTIVLESLPVNVSGKVLVSTSPKANAIVRAVNTDTAAIVVVSANNVGQYVIALKAGSWHLYAIADGYNEGDGGIITLSNSAQTRDLKLGELKQLVSSSANIVPTVSVTVTAAELGVTVGLPANALGSGSSATVTIRESSHTVTTSVAAPLPNSVRDVSASSSGSTVTSLNSAASIELNYNDDDLTNLGVTGTETNNLKVAYWDTGRNDWQVLESVVDTANRKVRAATNHFTLFAIVLPFLAQPASAEAASPPATVAEPASDERTAQFAAIVAEGTKVYVSGPDALALSINKMRDTSLELKYDADIVKRIVGSDNVAAGTRSTVVNFVTYGTTTTLHLGAGERGGVVSSFKSAYGHLPQSEYEWQEVIKIANGRWPGTLLQERELAMKTTFKKIYLREPVVTQSNDSAALAIMAYGLRSAKRNLASEAVSIGTFRAIYGYSPASATDWDAVRAISYSGAKR